jgi:hypothetical protein
MTREEVNRRLDEMEIALHRGQIEDARHLAVVLLQALLPRGCSVPMVLEAFAKATSVPSNERRRFSKGSGCNPCVGTPRN